MVYFLLILFRLSFSFYVAIVDFVVVVFLLRRSQSKYHFDVQNVTFHIKNCWPCEQQQKHTHRQRKQRAWLYRKHIVIVVAWKLFINLLPRQHLQLCSDIESCDVWPSNSTTINPLRAEAEWGHKILKVPRAKSHMHASARVSFARIVKYVRTIYKYYMHMLYSRRYILLHGGWRRCAWLCFLTSCHFSYLFFHSTTKSSPHTYT